MTLLSPHCRLCAEFYDDGDARRCSVCQREARNALRDRIARQVEAPYVRRDIERRLASAPMVTVEGRALAARVASQNREASRHYGRKYEDSFGGGL